jgi:hypothetical protein
MGGDDSQKLLPWRGIYSSPGRKPPAHYEFNTVSENWAAELAATPRAAGAQLLTAWVTFGKQSWVTSPARRRAMETANREDDLFGSTPSSGDVIIYWRPIRQRYAIIFLT